VRPIHQVQKTKILQEERAAMIVSCGEALIDFIPSPVAGEIGYLPRCGGSPFNTAIACARLGASTAFLGRISTDIFGDKIAAALAENAVSLRLVRRVVQPTTLAFVDLAGEEPQYAFFTENSAERSISPHDLTAVPEGVDCLHLGLGAYTLETEPFATAFTTLFQAARGKAVRSFDPNIRANMIADRVAYAGRIEAWLAETDLVKVSAADLEWLYGDEAIDSIAQRWLALGPQLVVVTRGGKGAIAFRAGHAPVTATAPSIVVVDAVGAGDSFTGGLLTALYRAGAMSIAGLAALDTVTLTDAVGYACRVAAVTCTRAGANPPFAHEVIA
jgi:fructokinase